MTKPHASGPRVNHERRQRAATIGRAERQADRRGAEVFDGIYRDNLWNGRESRSGPGSGRSATEAVARDLLELCADLGVRSVVDVGCGDSYWMPDLPDYVGIDVSAIAVGRARQLHPDRDYRVGDLVAVGPVDLVIVRDVIQHLPLEDGRALIGRIRAGWLLASTFTDGANVSIEAGDAFRPNLEVAPYDLGPPDRTIFDGYGYDDPTAIRDPGKFLGLWRL